MGVRSVTKKIIPRQIFQKVEPYGHHTEAVMLNVLAGMPSKNLKVIGITGTNGKTSTAFIVHRMLHEAGYKVGLMTTVSYGVGDDIKPQVAHMTSVSVPELIKRVKQMKKQGMDWLVLEVTSHALAQNRVWGVPFNIAILTNLTHEHLDYHGTFEKYRDAKRKLFQLTNRNKQGLQFGVINAEDKTAGLFASDIKHHVSYGLKEGDLRARSVRLTPTGSRYIVKTGDDELHIHCRLPGSFNVYNSLAAVAIGQKLGLSNKQIEDGIEALEGVEGRMTVIDEGQDFEAIVDYAHTPDSFEKLFKDMKPLVKGKLIVLFGSAGRRDESKRAIQGELAGKYADEVVITEEDDRDMDGQAIMEQIARGAGAAGKKRDKNLFLIHDRKDAIAFALKRAKKGDTVMLLGKGHEKDILRNGPRAAELRHLPQDDHNKDRVIEHKWDEIAVTKELLKQR